MMTRIEAQGIASRAEARAGRYFILDIEGTCWFEDNDLQIAMKKLAQLRADEYSEYEFCLFDRDRGPLTDEGEMMRGR